MVTGAAGRRASSAPWLELSGSVCQPCGRAAVELLDAAVGADHRDRIGPAGVRRWTGGVTRADGQPRPVDEVRQLPVELAGQEPVQRVVGRDAGGRDGERDQQHRDGDQAGAQGEAVHGSAWRADPVR